MTPATDDPPLSWDLNWSTIWDRVAGLVPDAPAIVSPAGTLSYAELEDRAARLAGALHRLGIRRGDRVGVYLYNRPEFLEAIYAAFKLGAIPVNMNFRYRARELAELIRICGARAIIHPATLGDEVSGAAAILRGGGSEVGQDGGTDIAQIVIADGPVSAGHEYESLLTERYDGPDERSGADRFYVFTGGTTGTPKAVVWRHGDLLDAQTLSIFTAVGLPAPTTEADFTAHTGRVPGGAPRVLPLAPLMHLTALVSAMNALVLGGSVVVLSSARLDPVQALHAIVDERVTRIIVVGNAITTPLIDALESAELAGAPYDVASVTSIISSGMAWTDDRKAELLSRMPGATLLDIIASTEGGPYAYSFVRGPAELPSRIELAAGASVIDEDGEPVAVGGTGVLAYSGPMPLGYLDEPAKTAEVYRVIDGVRRVSPGDWVRLLDEDGTVEFLGRGAAVVNTGGEKVYPAEVEEVLLAHPDVVDAAVFGVPDPRWGQAVAAVVAHRDGASVEADALRAFVGDRLAGYKKPQHLLVLDSLERGPSGKVDLARLRELVVAR